MRHGRESRWFKWFWRDRTGNAGAEFALGLLFLVPLMIGIIEIGRLVHDFHLANQSVRDASRFLARVPIDCTGATPAACTGATGISGQCTFGAADITRARNLAIYGTTAVGTPLLGYWTDPNTIDIEVCTVNNSTPDYAGIYKNLKWNGVVPHIRLTAHVPFTFLFGTMVVPSATMDIDVFHDTVAVGD